MQAHSGEAVGKDSGIDPFRGKLELARPVDVAPEMANPGGSKPFGESSDFVKPGLADRVARRGNQAPLASRKLVVIP